MAPDPTACIRPLMSDPSVPFGNYQYEVYLEGLGGKLLELPTSYAELEERAREALSTEAFGYVAGGAGAEGTMRANREALRPLAHRAADAPRRLASATSRTDVLGHRDARAADARAGRRAVDRARRGRAGRRPRGGRALGLPMIAEHRRRRTRIEDVAETMGDAPRWFQLYWPHDDELAASFVARAEAAGYERDRRHARHAACSPGARATSQRATCRSSRARAWPTTSATRCSATSLEHSRPRRTRGAAIGQWAYAFANPALTWDDLACLRSRHGPADRAQGHAAPGRRPPGGRRRRGRA